MGPLWVLSLALFAGASAAMPSRIIGGEPAFIDSFPSIVQVEFLDRLMGTWAQNCAGSILNTRYILSSAGCFRAGFIPNPNLRRIRAGSSFVHSGGMIVYVAAIFDHPSYDVNYFDGNIAVVRLSTALIYSPTIQRATVPPQGSVIPANLPVTVAGWGRIRETGPPSAILRFANIFTINHTLCTERYATYAPSHIPPITERMICAGLLDVGGRGSCDGDNGGPMFYGGMTIGIIFGSYGCANDTFPEISTNIGSYTDWIIETVSLYTNNNTID